MRRQYKGQLIDIRYSCLTGRAVWIHTGPTGAALRVAYCRACSQEVERINNWHETTDGRRSNVMRLLNDCLAGMSIMEDLPQEKKAAVRALLDIANNRDCDRDFYDHVMEERRLREEDRKIRHQVRDENMIQNANYDK